MSPKWRGIILPALASLLVVAAGAYAMSRWLFAPAPIVIAFANSMTGAQALAGSESLIATRMYVDDVNRDGGVNGHPIRLAVFDDHSDPATARANAAAVAASDAVAVLGHFFSNASMAASPIYQAAKLPAVTGTSLADQVTSSSPYYFRAQATISAEAGSIGEYIRQVWHAPKVSLLYSADANGTDFRQGFAQRYGAAGVTLWQFQSAAASRRESLRDIVEQLSRGGDPGVIVVGTGADSLPEVVEAIRRHGFQQTIITAANTGNEQLQRAFTHEPEEQSHPGFFTGKLYVAAPVFFDSTGPDAQAFGEAYAKASGRRPSWIGAGATDAARMLINALRRANLHLTPAAKTADRDSVRAALAAIDAPERAVPGVTGQLYFNSQRDITRSVRVGSLQDGRFVTAPEQLVLVEDPRRIDLAAETRAGHIVTIGDRSYWRQRIVYTGIDINKLSRIDVRLGVFNVDFYLWMRYPGDDDAPTRVQFPDLADKSTPLVSKDAFDPDHPLEAGQEGGLNYRLFRIKGSFGTDYNLRDYPFDTQTLLIRLQNVKLRRELIAYVVDRAGLKLAVDGAAAPDTQPYRELQLWRFGGLRYFVDSFASPSTLGKPENFANPGRTEFAGFSTAIFMHRNFMVFITKTLTPLFLLVMVVFSTLFFPHTLLKEQVTLPVTGILTSAVLLISMNNQLPDIGYGVAIEGVFYVFFALCLLAIVSAFVGEKLSHSGHKQTALVLNRSVKAIYVLTVFGTLFSYWFAYGR